MMKAGLPAPIYTWRKICYTDFIVFLIGAFLLQDTVGVTLNLDNTWDENSGKGQTAYDQVDGDRCGDVSGWVVCVSRVDDYKVYRTSEAAGIHSCDYEIVSCSCF